MRTLLFAGLLALAAPVLALEPVFTYQGRLHAGPSPASGPFEFEFELFDDPLDGRRLAGPEAVGPLQVEGGLFVAEIDFGFNPFAGLESWLEVRVRPGGSSDPFETLLPRQRMAPAPNALHAEGVALGAVGGAQLAPGAVTSQALSTGAVTSNALGTNAVSTAKLANNAVETAKLAEGAVTAAKANLSQIQARITAGCPQGQAISVVQESGQVLCTEVPQVDFRRFTRIQNMLLPLTVNLGDRFGFAIDHAGRPFISAYDAVQGHLIAVHCNVPDCSSFQINTVDADGIVGDYSSAAFRRDGRPIISYWSQTLNALRLATCGDASCATVQSIVTVDSGNVGQWTQLIVESGFLAWIAYHDYGQSQLKLARVNLNSDEATVRVASSAPGDGTHTDMTIISPVAGSEDLLIVHGNSLEHSLRLTRCFRGSSVACPTVTIDTGSAEVPLGRGNAVVLGPNGYPAIITTRPNENGSLRGARLFICANISCTQQVAAIDRGNCTNCNVLNRPLLWWGMDGALGFIDGTSGGRSHRCSDNECSVISRVDTTSGGGTRVAVQLGPDGMPWILNRFGSRTLILNRCGNRFCTEYGDGRY